MLRFNKLRWVRSALLLLAGGAGIVVGVLYANELAKIDPFARMRKQPESPLGQQIAMRLEDVDLWHYSEGKLVTTANVDRIDVHDSRQEISLFGVKNGAYKGDRGEFKYDAERAHWNAIAKRLEVSSGVRLRNKDMDLRTAGFTYSQESQVLSAPGQVSGTLNEGKLQASGFLYDMKEDTYRTGPTTWEGSVALFQDAGDTQRRPWRFKTDGITKPQGDVTTYENAEATDGEVIVKAPKLEYNRKT
ncbi:MAG TPA: LPS export ABC transporter periplasmic protein LptC, partial [Fimbriimonadaceae bacterium]|nr:LPS export ABC transporter periplasmic protein LptC [Fimbriimonadaceae bacterium]